MSDDETVKTYAPGPAYTLIGEWSTGEWIPDGPCEICAEIQEDENPMKNKKKTVDETATVKRNASPFAIWETVLIGCVCGNVAELHTAGPREPALAACYVLSELRAGRTVKGQCLECGAVQNVSMALIEPAGALVQ